MTFTDEQYNALSKYEQHFDTAVHASWSRYPGSAALDEIHSIYCSVTGDKRQNNKSCQSCIMNLLKDCGKLFYADKALRAKKEVKVEEIPTIQEKVSIKTGKRGRKASK